MSLVWSVRPEDAFRQLVQAKVDAIEADILAFAQNLTDQIAAWMKQNHRWQNRSGAAEAGLYSDVIHVVRQSVTILFSHGPQISYSGFLEYAHAGRLAILPDTLDHFFPVIFRGVQEIVRRHAG